MKTLFKIIVILCAFVSSAFAQTVNICTVSNPTCTSFQNSDNQAIYKAIIATSTLSPASTTINTSYNRYANGKLDSLKSWLTSDATGDKAGNLLRDSYVSQYASQGHLSNIYYNVGLVQNDYQKRINNKLDSLINYTRYNNNKQDSMLTATQTAELTFTVNSTNTGTAVTNTQALGVGAYSVTIPGGRWVIQSIHCIYKLQSATTTLRMYMMQGASNVSAVAEEAVYNLSSANALEVSQVYVSNTTNYVSMIWNSSTGAVSHFNVNAQPSILSENHVYTSGTLKLFLTYGSSITPANTNSYYFRIYLRRVS